MKKTANNLLFTEVSVEESAIIKGGDAASDLIREQLASVENARRSSTTTITTPIVPQFPILIVGILGQNIPR